MEERRKRWNLFLSGLLYGWVEFDRCALSLALLDVYTGKIAQARELDGELNARVLSLAHIDLFALPRRISLAQSALDAGKEYFQLEDGSQYQKKTEHSYIQRHIKFPLDLIVSGGSVVGVQTPGRESSAVCVDPKYESLTFLPAWKKTFGEECHPVSPVKTVKIPMRDGVCLATDLWLPAEADTPLACVLVRTPYGRESGADTYLRFVQRGFAVAIQDVRGRNESEGDWIPEHFETEDGSDTLDYLADQPWCSGRIGMIGGSYLGYVQWAAAASGNPHLKAMVSEVCSGSAFIDIPRRGGTLVSGMLAWAFAVSQRKMDAAKMARDDWKEVLNYRPLEDVCIHALGYPVPFWTEWLKHDCDDEFWQKGDWFARAKKRGGIDVPVLIMSGWFDDNGMGTTQALELTRNAEPGMRKVILGAWKHSGNADYDLHGVFMGDRAIRYDLDFQYFLWLRYHLLGLGDAEALGKPVEYFTLGQNQWKSADHWPPESVRMIPLYLAGKAANTRFGGGRLSFQQEMEDCRDVLTYDPENPATHIIDMSENELEVPEDYTKEEERADYLVYTSEPLKQDLTVTGEALVSLFVQSDVPDTDLVVRLTKVDQNGRSIKLADGLFNMKFVGGYDHKVYMKPDVVYPITIRTTKLSAVFGKGNRVRLTITSSAVNFIFPNPNTREGFAASMTQVAHNAFLRGKNYAARVELPIETG